MNIIFLGEDEEGPDIFSCELECYDFNDKKWMPMGQEGSILWWIIAKWPYEEGNFRDALINHLKSYEDLDADFYGATSNENFCAVRKIQS